MLPRRVCKLGVFLNDRSKRVSLGLQAKQVQSDLKEGFEHA